MDIREFLKLNTLLFDGAMGTYYAELTGETSTKCEIANIENPGLIKSIHEEYLKAGAMAVKTNTFGANPINLGSFSLTDEVIKKGFDIALKAAGDKAFVFADIGPVPSFEENNGLDAYTEIIDVFLNSGAENFLFETFDDSEYLNEIARYIKQKNNNAFIIVSFAVNPEGFSRKGISGQRLINDVSESPFIDACGFNCVSGPKHLLEYIKTTDTHGKPLSVMPNAGYPTFINNRIFYGNSPSYFGDKLYEIANQGAKIIGGCCGTSPEHIAKANALLSSSVKPFQTVKFAGDKPHKVYEKPAAKNPFAERLNSAKKAIAVELDPPLDTNIGFFMEGALKLKDAGVDAVTIADCPIAKARVDSSMLAVKLKSELDITPIPHLTCRDRNINATKALLLGLNIGLVSNVLAVTGDPVPNAEKDEVKALFSFNSADLAHYIAELNESVFSTPFQICGAININARNFKAEIYKAQQKIKNGMSVLFTQPAISEKAIENIKIARAELDVKIMGGLMPVVSYKNACFMNNEISGLFVEDRIRDMYLDKTKEEASQLAYEITCQMAEKMAGYTDGFYIITPFKRVDIITKIVGCIKDI